MNRTTAAMIAEPLLDVGGLAKLLLVSRDSVYRLVERGRIRFFRIPGGLRFRASDVQAFLDESRGEQPDDSHGGATD